MKAILQIHFGGEIIILAILKGYKMKERNLIPTLKKRLFIKGARLKNRNFEYKVNLTKKIAALLPYFQNGQLKPVIDKVYDWTDIRFAHEYMESNQNIGKIILKIGTS
jgi:NADPH:quinone reductase-like Zn-dependent oxidoreductase